MKKVFSLILAVAMVLSLGSVAFASGTNNYASTALDDDATAADNATVWDVDSKDTKYFPVTRWGSKGGESTEIYTYKAATHEFTKVVSPAVPEFGKTVYIPLYAMSDTDKYIQATQEKCVSGLKVSLDMENGASYIKGAEIVKVYGFSTDDENFDYTEATKAHDAYYIAIYTQGSNTAKQTVAGQIKLDGKTYKDKDSVTIKDESVHFAFSLGWGEETRTASDVTITLDAKKEGDPKTSLFDGKNKVYRNQYKVNTTDKTYEKADWLFRSDAEDTVTFDVTMYGDEKVLMKYSTDVNKALDAANVEAGIDYYSFNGATFKKSGELTFAIDEEYDNYLYQVNADGTLTPLNSKFDEEEGAFILTLKKLGNYALSDTPLVDATGTVAATVNANNPLTGAVA